MKELLEVTNLSYKDLFENISFQVEPEKFITISGANNCGKTTLIRILSGQIPTTQEIKLLGMYIEEYPQNLWKEITGTIIPQDNPTFLFKTVEEELNYTIHLFKTTAQNNKKKGKVIPLDITESISQAISHDNGPADSTRIALIR